MIDQYMHIISTGNSYIFSDIYSFSILFIFSMNAEAYPKATDRAQRWQLDVEVGDLFFHRDQESGQGSY